LFQRKRTLRKRKITSRPAGKGGIGGCKCEGLQKGECRLEKIETTGPAIEEVWPGKKDLNQKHQGACFQGKDADAGGGLQKKGEKGGHQ